MIRAGILLRLAPERVLVRAADTGGQHLDQHRPGLEPLRVGEALELEPPRSEKCCGEHVGVHRPDGMPQRADGDKMGVWM